MTTSGYADLDELAVRPTGSGVVVLTLNRPEKRNAMSMTMTRSWGRAIAALVEDQQLRAVVVTGAGAAFCAGGDVSWIGANPTASPDEHRERMMPFYRTWLAIRDLEVPTIAAINGPAVGAGLALALACDLRYAAEDAPLSTPFTSLGMHPGMAATYLLPQVAGIGLAREMLLAGRVVTGAEAVASGLVNQVFPRESVLAESMQVASRIAGCAPLATRLTKRALAGSAPAAFASALEWEALAQPVTLATEDLQEGLRAQREARVPRFTGR
jgi:enoyl-CoA hydratase